MKMIINVWNLYIDSELVILFVIVLFKVRRKKKDLDSKIQDGILWKLNIKLQFPFSHCQSFLKQICEHKKN